MKKSIVVCLTLLSFLWSFSTFADPCSCHIENKQFVEDGPTLIDHFEQSRGDKCPRTAVHESESGETHYQLFFQDASRSEKCLYHLFRYGPDNSAETIVRCDRACALANVEEPN